MADDQQYLDEPISGPLASPSISGRIFEDRNNNGINDDEPGIRWVLVQLRDTDGTIIAQTRSAADGSYRFEGIEPGDYDLRFGRAGDDRDYILPDQGNDDSIDSDVTPREGGLGFVSGVTVAEDAHVVDLDAGLAIPATSSISGRVWLDSDGDGLYNQGRGAFDNEPGLRNVLVQLRDMDGNIVAQTRSFAEGNHSYLHGDYSFEGLAPGEYVLRFGRPSIDGLELTTPNQGDDDNIDSDAMLTGTGVGYTQVIRLGANEDLGNHDAGYRVSPGEAVGEIKGRVFEDTNENGIDDEDEPGVAGVYLYLTDAAMQPGTDDQNAVVTGADGSYSFTGLEPGSYAVNVHYRLDVLSDGRSIVPLNVGRDETVDSDFFAYTGAWDQFTPWYWGAPDILVTNADPVVDDIDLGVTPVPTDPDRGSISGRVFLDLNGNGLDDGEPGIAGHHVELFWGVPARENNIGQFAITDEDGNYSYSGLVPRDYTLTFRDPGPDYSASPANLGDDDSIDSDGSYLIGGVIAVPTFTLNAGEALIDHDQGFVPDAPAADEFVMDI